MMSTTQVPAGADMKAIEQQLWRGLLPALARANVPAPPSTLILTALVSSATIYFALRDGWLHPRPGHALTRGSQDILQTELRSVLRVASACHLEYPFPLDDAIDVAAADRWLRRLFDLDLLGAPDGE